MPPLRPMEVPMTEKKSSTVPERAAAERYAYEYLCEHSETLSQATVREGLATAYLAGQAAERERCAGIAAEWLHTPGEGTWVKGEQHAAKSIRDAILAEFWGAAIRAEPGQNGDSTT